MRSPQLVLLAVAVSAACRDSASPASPPPLCTFPVAITASAGTTPTFQWPGGCGVTGFYVRRDSTGGTIKWSLSAPDSLHPLTSPISFGQVPAGSVVNASATALSAGTGYRALITVPNGPGFALIVGDVSFTP